MSWSSSLTDAFAQGSPPTVPEAGSTFNDPIFDTEILRVTDASTEVGAGNFGTAYSYWPTFNANNTKLLALGSSSRIFDFDPDAFTLGSSIVAPSGVVSYEYNVYWSRTNPNIMYGVNGLEIRSMDVSAGTPSWTTIATYTEGELGIAGANYFFQIHISDDDNVLSATVRNSSDAAIGIVAVRLNASKEVYYSEETTAIDEVQIDKSGVYLVHKTGNQGAGVIEVRIINIITDAVEELEDDAPDYAPGHSDNGSNFIVGEDNWRSGVTVRPLDNPQSNANLLLTDGGTFTWFTSGHISMRMSTDTWALYSFYSSVSTTRFNNELFFLNTSDGSVRRFVKHYSGTDYDYLPKANVSMDGKFVAFTSSYTGASSGRHDLYIARVPADMGIWDGSESSNINVMLSGGASFRGGVSIR